LEIDIFKELNSITKNKFIQGVVIQHRTARGIQDEIPRQGRQFWIGFERDCSKDKGNLILQKESSQQKEKF
jgi:hypothetical protein